MKKRLGTLVGVTCALFVLTSCGSTPQDEFVKYMEGQQKQTEGTYDFKFAIKELDLASSPETANNPMMGMIATQLKDMSVTGTMKSNTKQDNAFSMDMKINALGMEIPVNMMGSFGKEPKMYMATDIMEYFMTIVSSMSGMDMTAGTDYSKLKGKYMDVYAMDDTMDQAAWADMVKDLEKAQKNQEKLNKKVIEYMKGLDKKTFTKEKDVISHTFTDKEIVELLKVVSEDSEADMTDIKDAFKEFDKVAIKVDLDTKADKTSMVIDMAPKTAEAEAAGFKSISLLFEGTLKDKKAEIVFPKKEDILTQKQMEEFFPEAPAAGLPTAITDEEFTELKSALEEAKGSIDEATKKELLATYKDFLTEAQYKEIEALLK